MKNEKTKTRKNPLKPKMSAFFRKETLVFKTSGHLLRKSDRHYRCDLSCRGKCKENEPQLNKENFERNFSRFAKKFSIEKKTAERLWKKMISKYLIQIIEQTEEKVKVPENSLHATLAVMNLELTKKGKLKKSDIKDFESSFIASQGADSSLTLFAYAAGFIKALSYDESERQAGTSLALLARKIYLSNTGKIVGIELEKWGWYILNYINREESQYLFQLRKNGVEIYNEDNAVNKMEFAKALEYFEETKLLEAMSTNVDQEFLMIMTVLKKTITNLTEGDLKTNQTELRVFFEMLASNPKVQTAFKLSQFFDKYH